MTLERPPSNDPWERIGPFRLSGASELALHDLTVAGRSSHRSNERGADWQLNLAASAPDYWLKGATSLDVHFGDATGRVAICEPSDVIEVSSAAGRWFAKPGRRSAETSGRPAKRTTTFRAPLPGRSSASTPQPDRIVPEGDPLVILSAMKIEIVLRAPKRCRVKAVHCHPDEQVDAGDLLVEVVPEEEA